MLKNLSLKNFQNHKNSHLEFSPNINIITGSSDQGKSSIIRALYWICFNKPSGQDFINRNADECSVVVEFNDNTVERLRSSTKNEYVVNGEKLKAMRGSVPDEVQSATRISSTNIQTQFKDTHFLLDRSPGEVAQSLNKISGLEDIDQTLYNINSRVKQVSKDKDNHETNIQNIRNELAEFEYLEDLESEVVSLESKYEELESLYEDIEYLNEIIQNYKSKEKQKQELQFVYELDEQLNKLLSDLDKFKELSKQFDIIWSITKQLKNLYKNKDKLKSEVEVLSSTIKKLDEISQDLNILNQSVGILNNVKKLEDQREEVVKEHDRIKSELDEILKDIDFCPFCGSKADKEKLCQLNS